MAEDSFECRCVKCDYLLPSGSSGPGWTSSGPCPECGSSDVIGKIKVHDAIGRVEDAFSYVGRDALTNKKILHGHARPEETKTGLLTGTEAWVEQLVDKSFHPGRYKKKVTLSDGRVIKDQDGPLDDQSLHGPQQPMP